MMESLRVRDLDVRSFRVAIEGLRVASDVEIAPRHVVFVELDFSGTPHVHEVRTLVDRENPLQRFPVRLFNADWDIGRRNHKAASLAFGGTPTWVCLQPMQQTAAVTFRRASSKRRGTCIDSPPRV